jgi:hypothetical protein
MAAPLFAGGAAAAEGGALAAGGALADTAAADAVGGFAFAGDAAGAAAGAAEGLGAAAGVGAGAAADAGLGLTDWGAEAAAGAGGASDAAAAATGGFYTGGETGLSSAVSYDPVTAAANSIPSAPPSYGNPLGGGTPSMSPTDVGGPSSLWDKSLGVAKTLISTPGVPTLLGGILQGVNQASLMNAQMKYQAARAPGQIAGGAGNAWGGFPTNKNITAANAATANPHAAPLPQLTPYTQAPQTMTPQQIPVYQPAQEPMPGYGQSPYSAQYPGYGLPGYGQQPPAQQQQGLLSQTPFIDSPYDQSYA